MLFLAIFFALAQSQNQLYPAGYNGQQNTSFCVTTIGNFFFVATYVFNSPASVTSFTYFVCGNNGFSGRQNQFGIYNSAKQLIYTQNFTNFNSTTKTPITTTFTQPQNLPAGTYYIGVLTLNPSFTTVRFNYGFGVNNSMYLYNIQSIPQSFGNSFATPTSVFYVLYVTYSSQSQCNALSCTTCASSSACTWCFDSNSCIAQTQSCADHTNNPQKCGCYSASNCNSCTTTSNQNCTWCENPSSSACIPSALNPSCQTVITKPRFCDVE